MQGIMGKDGDLERKEWYSDKDCVKSRMIAMEEGCSVILGGREALGLLSRFILRMMLLMGPRVQ